MKLQLNTWQRLQLLLLMSNVQGDLRVVNKALKLIDLLEFSKEEAERIGLEITPAGYYWRDDSPLWEIDIEDGNLAPFLKERVKDRSDWPARKDVMDLCQQLEISLDSEN
jgi:hypothetical protein